MRKRYTVLIVVIVILLIVVGGGYLALHSSDFAKSLPFFSSDADTKSNSADSSPVTPIVNIAPRIDAPANWIKYTNLKYHYSLKYPPSWKAAFEGSLPNSPKNQSDVVRLGNFNFTTPPYPTNASHVIISLSALRLDPAYPCLKDISNHKKLAAITVAGVQGTTYKSSDQGTGEKDHDEEDGGRDSAGQEVDYRAVLLCHNNTLFQLSFMPDDPNPDLVTTYDQILGSLKFNP